jgi:hypothetical protein
MQCSATVFHGVREAKVTTNCRGTESACTYRFDPLPTVRLVVLVGKQVSAREALLQPTPCRSHSWNATDEAKEARRVAARKRRAKERDEDSNYWAALQRDPSAKCLMDRSAASGNRWCVS